MIVKKVYFKFIQFVLTYKTYKTNEEIMIFLISIMPIFIKLIMIGIMLLTDMGNGDICQISDSTLERRRLGSLMTIDS